MVSSQPLANLFSVNCVLLGVSGIDVQTILKQVEELLTRAGELPVEAEQAVGRLLNLVEALSVDKSELAKEVERLRQQLEQKKNRKTTDQGNQDDGATTKNNSDHSSEKRRRRRDKKTRNTHDRRSFKDLPIHEEIECPVDPATLPPDAVRVEDESVVVQDIEIKPRNVRFQRHVYYSAATGKYFRGPLPSGYDVGDFGADLRALVLSLKYCGGMSEPKIGEFLENFDVLVCDDAGQFKLLTDHLALCWIHAGRHYERLSPVAPRHARALDNFAERYWDFYASLQDYRAGPSEAWATKLRQEFDELFATRTGYDVLDDRIAKMGCSYILMLRGECGAAILVNFLPELLPAAWGESQPAYRQHGKSSIVLPTRTRFA